MEELSAKSNFEIKIGYEVLKPMIHGSTFVEQQMLNEGEATC